MSNSFDSFHGHAIMIHFVPDCEGGGLDEMIKEDLDLNVRVR